MSGSPDHSTLAPPGLLSDITEERTDSGAVSRMPSQNTLIDSNSIRPIQSEEQQERIQKHHEGHEHPPPSSANTPRARKGSTTSRVSIDYFDPEGVADLRRTFTQDRLELPTDDLPKSGSSSQTGSSDHTLITDLTRDGEFDLEKMIRHLVLRRDKGEVKLRELGVGFRDLNVVGLGTEASYQPTFGSMFNPKDILRGIQNARHPPVRDILSGFEGVVKPGEMLLVLGSPGAGCSTLLKTLANHRDEYHAVNGEVHYDSISPANLKRYFRGDVQYCPEDDVHFPTLTVEQTIQFAARTRTPRNRVEYSRKEFQDLLTNVLTTIFGLRHAKNTFIGDAMIRGVSGGEKKRVSIAESLATRACIGLWDNSTRGLDSSTALEFVRALRLATDILRLGTIVSIYQAGESLYKHFDKVCIIYEGRMAYFGPADKARDYFIEMGYVPANRQTTADFLVAVTDPNARIRADGITNQPRTAAEFADYFKKSQLGQENREEVDAYISEHVGQTEKAKKYIDSARAEFAKRSGSRNPYMLTLPQQVAAVMRRKTQIIKGNATLTTMMLLSFIFQALIIGSTFYKMTPSTNGFFSRGGLLFFSLLFAAFTSMSEIPALYFQRRIIVRHEKAALYHPFVEALAHTLVDIPITFAIMAVFNVIMYFLSGLQISASQFFVYFLFVIVMTIAMKSWFRAIAAAFKSEATANTVAGVSILALAIYTGYTLPKPTMIGALRWITYINPLRYGFEAVMTNEFRTLNGACDNLIPRGEGYENVSVANQVCAVVGARSGENFVQGSEYLRLAYQFEWSNTWMNLGIVIAFGIGFLIALLVFSEYNTSIASDTVTTLFKRGTTRAIRQASAEDEEKVQSVVVDEKRTSADKRSENRKRANTLKMTDTFTWQKVRYSVPIDGEDDRTLLEDVSGFVAPGKLTALMGESGAGKTTLLNVLAKRVFSGNVSGDMLVNGQPLPIDFQSQTGYCQQMDTHVPTSTVREALLFSAKLRQPPSVPLSEKEAYVDQCLRMCGLEDYADAIVGSLNVEYRKRTTIAVELAAKPRLLLFLDEPTSGLDSQSAWAIISFLRSLADQGQAILCTIHQPSAELFQVFDRMLLLKKGGQTVYFGDIGHNSSTLIQYFERNGARHCDPSENPAEYMLEVIGAGATATTAFDWHTIWKSSPEGAKLQSDLDAIHTEGRNRPAVQAELHSEFATSWIYQVKELLARNVQAYWRDPTYIFAKLALNVVSGLFIGFTFYKSDNSLQGIQNKLFAVFMAIILSVPLANQLLVPFIDLRSVYEIRERPSRMYSWTALVASQILVEVPWNMVGSNLLFFTWYWPVGFPASRAAYSYLMVGYIFPAYFTTIAQAVAAMSPNAEIAALLFSVLFSFVVTFNGVMQPYHQLGFWKWMYRLSPFTYLIEGLLGQVLGKQDVQCSPIELVKVTPPSGLACGEYLDAFISRAGGYVTDSNATDVCNYCSSKTTDQFMALSFEIYYSHRWRNVGFMVVFIIFNIFAIFALTYLFRIHTGSFFKRSRK